MYVQVARSRFYSAIYDNLAGSDLTKVDRIIEHCGSLGSGLWLGSGQSLP